MAERDLILVSNRLPATVETGAHGSFLRPSTGGLVTALRAILAKRKGYWVGSAEGQEEDLKLLLGKGRGQSGYKMIPISLTQAERSGFYAGFSNEIVWPLFHDLQSRCNFDPSYWKAYVEVNRKFAEATRRAAKPASIVWVHDYHLMLVGEFLRKENLKSRLGFFLHIPFPPLDIFEKLPWRSQVLQGLLQFDLVGFQTPRDQRNFLGCVRRLLPEVAMERLDDQVRMQYQFRNRTTLIGSFPIGIDFDEFSRNAEQSDVEERADRIRSDMRGRQIALGVDRLDYTKGIPERLKAFQHLLEHHENIRRKISLVQIVVPSRERIPKYRDLRLEIETLVSRINGQFGDPGWMPVHYIHRSLHRPELLALYRAADIALITPLKDGMNLVSKEFCAAQVREHGVLILSEFAGSAEELRTGAMLVNPYDIESVAEAVYTAFEMKPADRAARMHKLRRKVRNADVFRWSEHFCSHLESGRQAPHKSR